MPIITGTIEAVSFKEVNTKFGPKQTTAIRVNKEWFNNGFKKLNFDKGDEVEIAYDVDRFGNKIEDLKAASGAAPKTIGAASAARGPAGYPVPEGHSSIAIIMQNAMSQVMKSLEMRPEFTAGFENDDQYWNYVFENTASVAGFLAGHGINGHEVSADEDSDG